MSEHPVLGQVALGFCPMIDRQRSVMATRLTVFPLRPEITPDAGELLRALGEVWLAQGAQQVSLNIASEDLLRDSLAAQPPAHMMFEVPAFMAADAQNEPLLHGLHAQGSTLLIKGRPAHELPAAVLGCFKHSIIELGEDRRSSAEPPSGASRCIGFVQSGVSCISEVEDSFKRGAVAVLGWPIGEPVGKGSGKTVAPDLKVIVELMNRVDRQEPIDRLEAVLKNDPTLAFRLVRYINSAAFGLRVEISSFRHAIMMLGYEKLKRWLALLLASASTDPNMKPVLFAAVRRGLFMEELVRSSGDEQMRSEMFICGVFSLLDCMLGQPFDQLLKSIPVPQDVVDALVHGTGRYRPYIDVVRAVEQESLFDIREAAEALMLSVAEINRALLRALVAARQLD
ncbi:MAG TPA: HDOD domain-containing protein [Rubrivivax sp.]|nr:HDOD domain-containing protein [Rubrivivax sp.]